MSSHFCKCGRILLKGVFRVEEKGIEGSFIVQQS